MFNGRTPDYDEGVIENGGFWSEIAIAEFQKQRAIPLQIPLEMVRSALVQAMQELDLELADVESQYRESAVNSVAEIQGNHIGGENFAETLYKKAVFARAKATLLPEFNTLSGREIHENREYVTEQKSLLAEATHAIRVLKGKRRGSVYLV